MTNKQSFAAEVNCHVEQHSADISFFSDTLIFAYSLTNEMSIEHDSQTTASVPVGHIAQLQTHHARESHKQDMAVIRGQHMIIVHLRCLALS